MSYGGVSAFRCLGSSEQTCSLTRSSTAAKAKATAEANRDMAGESTAVELVGTAALLVVGMVARRLGTAMLGLAHLEAFTLGLPLDLLPVQTPSASSDPLSTVDTVGAKAVSPDSGIGSLQSILIDPDTFLHLSFVRVDDSLARPTPADRPARVPQRKPSSTAIGHPLTSTPSSC